MSETTDNIRLGSDTYQCMNCGAALKYRPGTDFLHCDYCGTDTPINAKKVEEVHELDFEKYAQNFEQLNTKATKIIGCRKCGAESTFNESVKSATCPYCTTPLIESDVHEERLIQPSYLLPFKIEGRETKQYLDTWLKRLWFAPNKLKKQALHTNKLQGVYIPCWTYDAQTETDYSGQRGTRYTTTVGTGKNRRTVTQTSWRYCQGHVSLFFDDVLVPASGMIPRNIMDKINNWDSMNMVEADNRFLSGFIAEKYVMNMNNGYEQAKMIMNSHIEYAIRSDIGGDEQRINSKQTTISDVKFKLILLPVYMSSYIYKNKLYHFFLNARTGRVTGDRPYSPIKIAFAVIAGIAALIIFITLLNSN